MIMIAIWIKEEAVPSNRGRIYYENIECKFSLRMENICKYGYIPPGKNIWFPPSSILRVEEFK
jgi:hypothetical protein